MNISLVDHIIIYKNDNNTEWMGGRERVCIPPIRPLQTPSLNACNLTRNPNLSHIMGFRGPGIPLDHVLERRGEDGAVRVGREAGGWCGAQDEEDRARDVAARVGGYPGLV